MLTSHRQTLARLAVAVAAVGASATPVPAQPAPARQTAVEPGRAAGEAGQPAQPISPEKFDKLQAMIRPHPGEAPWSDIPWLTDAWEARQKAAKEGKPIFAWLPAGEPLGCT